MEAEGMSAETALRLQAANDHLGMVRENLAAINAGPDVSAATRTASVQCGLAGAALAVALAGIPSSLLLPEGGEQP